ncbi:MAG TPA: hypothetical protein VFG59_21440 [Anaeromyxobacter sp.]|nr:hypothetical protein [Anaeromyxobacter sp.]
MPRPFADKNWLSALTDEALASQAALSPARPSPASSPADLKAAARLLVSRSLRVRAPSPGLDPAETFRQAVLQHVLLLLELRQLVPDAPPGRARREVAAFLCTVLDLPSLALRTLAEPGDLAIGEAMTAAGKMLRARFYPPGDPRSGLPLHSGSVAVLRRHLGRVASGYLRHDRLDPAALHRHADFAAQELLLLAEALSGLASASAAPDRRARWVRSRQMGRLGFRGAQLREARRRVAVPRAAEELAQAAPPAMRGFLFEQLLLAQLRARASGEEAARFVETFAQASQLEPQAVIAAQAEAAAQSGDPQAWFEGSGKGGPNLDWHAVADEVGTAAGSFAERLTTMVSQNLGALATEIRETGELGTLLTKAAAGGRLTAEEKRKVRAQLIDLAKAVPALAMFAAPGGSILLPLLVKLLPFNLLPSAWDKVGLDRGPRPPLPRPSPETKAEKPDSSGDAAAHPLPPAKPVAGR